MLDKAGDFFDSPDIPLDVSTPTPTPNGSEESSRTIASASSSPDRSDVGLAIIATLLFVMVVAVILVRRKKRRTDATMEQQQNQQQDVFGFNEMEGVVSRSNLSEWFRTTDASIVTPNVDQSRAGDSFCGSWEHPDVLASRLPLDQIRLGQLAYHGSTSDVYRAKFRGEFVAVKKPCAQWLANVRHMDAFFCEVRLLASLRHPNIVTFIGVAWRSLLDVQLVSEFMDGGDLRGLLTRFDTENMATYRPRGFDKDKVNIAAQVASSLAYLHAQTPRTLVHMALRSKNVLLSTQWTAKLIDFRAASVEKYIYDLPSAATRGVWSAPEVLRGEKADEKADIFSFGVLLSEIDSHRTPYSSLPPSSSTTSTATMSAKGSDTNSAKHSVREVEDDRASSNNRELLARIASGRIRVEFSSATSSSAASAVSMQKSAPTAGELVCYRQARGTTSSNGNAAAANVRSVISLVSAASFVASPFVHAEVVRIGQSCIAMDPRARPSARELERELLALAQTFDTFEGK